MRKLIEWVADPETDMVWAKMVVALLAGMAIGVLVLAFGGCASPPETLCAYHKANPGRDIIRSQLEDACLAGTSKVACDLLNEYVKAGE